MGFQNQIFTFRPWESRFGEPDDPSEVVGVPVIKRLLLRANSREALVVLEDRRVAITGDTVVVGPIWLVQVYLMRMESTCDSSEKQAWLSDVASALDEKRLTVSARTAAKRERSERSVRTQHGGR